jgi:hypothetical protein
MNQDYEYCSGVECKLKKDCKRYLPDPPNEPLWWINVHYNEKRNQCPLFENKTNENDRTNHQ